MLHEELGHRQPIPKQVTQHHYVGPAHVVADDEIPAILAQSGVILNLPVDAGGEADHQGVAGQPEAHETVVEAAAGAAKGRNGQQQLGQRHQQDQAGAQGGEQNGQAGADEQHQGAGEQGWHGRRLLRLVRQQLVQGLVLLAPDPVQPLLKLLLELGVIEVIPHQIAFDRQKADPNLDLLDPTAHEVPVTGDTARIGDGHIHQLVQLIAHGRQGEGDAASPRVQQVAIGRGLFVVLAGGEAGALHEVHHAHRNVAKLGTGLARCFYVLSLQMRPFFQKFTGIAPHEGEVQRPPCQTEKRYPNQFFLEEKLQEGDFLIKNPLQHQYVDPGLMVGNDHIPLIPVPFVHSDHLERRSDDGFLDQIVETYPATGTAVQQGIAEGAPALERQQQLDQTKQQYGDKPEQGVEEIEQGREAAAQPLYQLVVHESGPSSCLWVATKWSDLWP